MVVSGGRRASIDVTREAVVKMVAVFERTGSIGAAARSAGCAHSTARRHLVRVGLVAAEPMPLGKPDERARFESTDPTSWNTSPKNSTPDHERRSTGQPQPSVFVIYSRRPKPLGKTHRCCEHPVNPPTGDGAPFAIDRE